MHLVGVIIRIYHNARSPECQIWFMVYKVALWQVYLLVLQFISVSFIPPVLHTHPINQPSITSVIKPQQLTASLYNKPKIKAKSQVLIETHTSAAKGELESFALFWGVCNDCCWQRNSSKESQNEEPSILFHTLRLSPVRGSITATYGQSDTL